MAFLTKDELLTHLYGEVIDNISQNDDDIVIAAIDAAIAEAKGYLSRYDLEALFSADPKDAILLVRVKDIAVWHFLVLGNQSIELEFREARYTEAVKWLEKIQSGKSVPQGWPLPTPSESDPAGVFKYGSNPKRNNHY
ncbi:phage protein Gp36 family protein [Solitalea koreensis]|uniref:DUF1320 domain-containing protein n=1 Tax=Solitalea koreensis TaxID=543615 RepID=A0A521BM43_9SPHI|nr:phage protein Gp36 family protein [Solitalea koreensis]SMO48193.1 Protein of unknown function [Solitalea koreensis]